MAKTTVKIPFTRKEGDLVNYPRDYDPSTIVWKENYIFYTILEIESVNRGRSAANFNVVCIKTGRKFVMFLTDLLDIVKNSTIENGLTEGQFTFCKRGRNYGIKRVKGHKT